MQIVDLFSGIGGFSLSGSWLGWRTVQFCEIDEFCQHKLKKHWPDVPIHSDIKTLTADQIINNGLYDKEETTILTGGFPCQGFSVAGKQRGKDDPRWLWPEMLRVIREIQPAWIVGENVPGIIRMELENICASLESEGYDVQPFIIPSAGIGAWDRRNRVWIIAHNNEFGCNNEQKGSRETLSDTIRITKIKKQSRRLQQCRTGESDFISADIEESRIRGLPIQQRGQDKTKNINPEREIKINSDTDKLDRDNAGYNSGAISQQQTSGIQINNNIISKGLQGHSWNELSKRQQEQTRQTGQANWLRDWIEVASELCRSNARVPSELDEIINLYKNGNSNNKKTLGYQETIAKIDFFRREILRDMWCEKYKIKQTSQQSRQERFYDIMYTMPYQYTHERWNLGQRIEKNEILCNMWNRILSSPFEKTQNVQSEMLERIREIERNEKAGHDRTNRIKALGNSVNPYVVYQIFKPIETVNNLSK